MGFELIDYTTGLGVLVKQPAESRVFRMDLTNLLVGATIASITSVGAANQGLVPGSSAVTITNQVAGSEYVEFRIAGGTHNENYKVTVVAVDTAGNTIEGEGMLYCREI